MADSNLHPVFAGILGTFKPVAVEEADGYLVITKMVRGDSVAPPYKYEFNPVPHASLETAREHYAELERGEYGRWQAVAIVECKGGVPIGARKVTP